MEPGGVRASGRQAAVDDQHLTGDPVVALVDQEGDRAGDVVGLAESAGRRTTDDLVQLALVQAVLPSLRERRGAILNITSDAAVEDYATWGGYGTSKAALEQLSNVLAAEEPDVAVWWADPGEMNTAMLRAAGEDADAAPPPSEAAAAFRRLVETRPPSGRYTASGLMDER